MSKGLEKTFLQRKHISGKQVYEKMFDITINRVMQIKVQRGIFSQLMSIITKKKKKPSKIAMLMRMWRNWNFYTVGGNVKWYSHCGKQNDQKPENRTIPDSAVSILGI